MAPRVMSSSAPEYPRIGAWISSGESPLNPYIIGRRKDRFNFLCATVKETIILVESQPSTKKQIERGLVRLSSPSTVNQESESHPEDSGVDTVYTSGSESETSGSYDGDYLPRISHKTASAETIAGDGLFKFSSANIKARGGEGSSRGQRAAGISHDGQSSRAKFNGNSTGGGEKGPNKRKHHGDDQGGRSKKPHVSGPQEPELESSCMFYLAEPHEIRFKSGGSHFKCRSKHFTKISDHNQHNDRTHPPKDCPKCGLKIIDTAKAQKDHQMTCLVESQNEIPNETGSKGNGRCYTWDQVARRCLGPDLSAYRHVESHIKFREAAPDVSEAYKSFMQEDPTAVKLKDALRELFFRSTQFKQNVIEKHDVLKEFKSGDLDWVIGDLVWRSSFPEIPEAPSISDPAQTIDQSIMNSENRPVEAACEAGGHDTSTKHSSPNSAGTPLYPALMHHPPSGAVPMNSSSPSTSDPQALIPDVPQDGLSNAQSRTPVASGSFSSQRLNETNSTWNSSQTSHQHLTRPFEDGRQASAHTILKPSAVVDTITKSGVTHSSDQVSSNSASSRAYTKSQREPSEADIMHSRSQNYSHRPTDRPGTDQLSCQPIRGLHSGGFADHCSSLFDPMRGGDQMGFGTPPTRPIGEELMRGLSGVNAGFNSEGQYSLFPGIGIYSQDTGSVRISPPTHQAYEEIAPPYLNSQINAKVSSRSALYTQHTNSTGPGPHIHSPDEALDGSYSHSLPATKISVNGANPQNTVPTETYSQTYQFNPHNNQQSLDPRLATEVIEEHCLSPESFYDSFLASSPR